ncbi:unnamed protein product [Didymodactylos carnosus]|uniref:Transmembrane protein n=1 Tax=Didymodactylos carnosus TaxID=1234261 RepID=A0A814MWS2_9BILA|nr:unnamed protein product [Didymodactylos carnosus]CAF3851066.1 unnamed protein product [Didymodactylos carnosus]
MYNETCQCSVMSTCIEQAGIYDTSTGQIQFLVPGFLSGCYIIEALLQSSLVCLYDQTCLGQLSYIDGGQWTKQLNVSYPSRYSPDTLIQKIIDSLMIEQLNTITSYESYYQECQPTCYINFPQNTSNTSSMMVQQLMDDNLTFVAIILGLAAAISIILKILILCLVNLFICTDKNGINIVPVQQVDIVMNTVRQQQIEINNLKEYVRSKQY